MPLAFQIGNRYPARIMAGVFDRFSTMVLILSLVLGPAGSGMRAASMIATMVPLALSAAHSLGNCNDCAGSKSGVRANACSVYCAGMVAISPDVATIDEVPAEAGQYLMPHLLAGHHVFPDPHPPRSVVLS